MSIPSLYNRLLSAGHSPKDAAALVKATIDQLLNQSAVGAPQGNPPVEKKAIPRSLTRVKSFPVDTGPSSSGKRLEAVPFSTIEARPLEWLWPRRVMARSLNVLAGNPGVGKSFLSVDIACRLSTGAPWPDGAGKAPRGNTLIVSAEDDPGDTIRPRIDAHGGDPARIHLVTAQLAERPDLLQIDLDFDLLENLVRESGATLVIIDPILSYLSDKVNANAEREVRRALNPLNAVARRTGACILALSHLNKKTDLDAMYRVGGAMAFVGLTRNALLATEDQHDPGRFILSTLKLNAAKKPTGLAYRIIPVKEGSEQGRLVFDDTPVVATPNELLGAGDHSALDRAVSFLQDVLKDGPVSAEDATALATAGGLSLRTIERAKKRLRVVSKKGAGGWAWELPGGRTVCV